MSPPPNLPPAMRLLWLIANKSHQAWEAAYDKHQRQDREGADETVSKFLVWLQGELKGEG